MLHYIYIEIPNMPNKKKLNPASTQANKLIAELPGRREKITAQEQFRHYILESQKRINYQSEFDRLQGSEKKKQYTLIQNIE